MDDIERWNMEAVEGYGIMIDLPNILPPHALTMQQKTGGSDLGGARVRGQLTMDGVIKFESMDAVRFDGYFEVTFASPTGIPAGRYGLQYVGWVNGNWHRIEFNNCLKCGWPAHRVIGASVDPDR